MGSGGGSSTSITYMYPEWVRSFYERANNATWSDAAVAKSNNPYKNLPISPNNLVDAFSGLGKWIDKQLYNYDPKLLFDILIAGPENIPDNIFGLLKREEVLEAIKGQSSAIIRTVEEDILPKYRRGMQNIGAVNNSSFKIGEALLWKGQLDSLTDKYYEHLVVPAFNKSLEMIDKTQEIYFRKLALLLTYSEMQMKIDEGIYNAQQNYADNLNAFEASRLSWGLEIDKMLVMAAGSWQSTPQSSETKQKQSSNTTGSIIGGILGIGSLVTGLFGGF